MRFVSRQSLLKPLYPCISLNNTSLHIWQKLTFSRNTSLLVNLLTAIKESCTIPMTGLFDWGVTTFLGTIMISVISARASKDCGTCKFISSPSKSALYGVVTLKCNKQRKYLQVPLNFTALRSISHWLPWHNNPRLILKGFYNIFLINWLKLFLSISFFNPLRLQSLIKRLTSQYQTPTIILSDKCAQDSNLSSHKWFGWQVNSYLRLSLKVDQGKILTLCPIMDILWRVGWRLKIITSSSLMCRSTLYPNWRWRSLGFGWNLRSILSPLSLIMYLAPGYWLLPRRTNSCMLIIKRQKDYS